MHSLKLLVMVAKKRIKKSIIERDCKNIELLDAVDRSELIDIYAKADILFLHLNDFLSFRKVLPSKIFEYAASGKPIIAGVAGCAKDMLLNEVSEHLSSILEIRTSLWK